jgi:hypothetical protein
MCVRVRSFSTPAGNDRQPCAGRATSDNHVGDSVVRQARHVLCAGNISWIRLPDGTRNICAFSLRIRQLNAPASTAPVRGMDDSIAVRGGGPAGRSSGAHEPQHESPALAKTTGLRNLLWPCPLDPSSQCAPLKLLLRAAGRARHPGLTVGRRLPIILDGLAKTRAAEYGAQAGAMVSLPRLGVGEKHLERARCRGLSRNGRGHCLR